MAFRFLDQYPVYLSASGEPLAGGSLTFYETGTTTPKTVYTSKSLGTPASNPHTLTSQGRPTTDIWGSGSYRVVLKDSAGATVWTRDDVDELLTGSGIPSQATHSGKFLTTNGSVASWGVVSQVPSVTGNTGKYLYTDGSTASWRNPSFVPAVTSIASSATITPDAGSDLTVVTALAVPATIANPSGSWSQGQAAVVRIKDNGTARALSFGGNYRAVGVTLPTTTVANKTVYIAFIYNSTDAKWDVTGVGQEA
ncbi:MAG: hypothetical protein ACO3RW_07900 [Burkholderiaceae bacterium]